MNKSQSSYFRELFLTNEVRIRARLELMFYILNTLDENNDLTNKY